MPIVSLTSQNRSCISKLGAGHYLSAGGGGAGGWAILGGVMKKNSTPNGGVGAVKISFMNPWGGSQI